MKITCNSCSTVFTLRLVREGSVGRDPEICPWCFEHTLAIEVPKPKAPPKPKFQIVIGDWSDDGHGKYDCFVVTANKPVEEVQDAIVKATIGNGFFRDTVMGTDEANRWAGGLTLCDRYEVKRISDPHKSKLIELIPDIVDMFDVDDNDIYLYEPEDMVDLVMSLAKTELPDLEYTYKYGKHKTTLNGYWNKRLNWSFGYGLYD